MVKTCLFFFLAIILSGCQSQKTLEITEPNDITEKQWTWLGSYLIDEVKVEPTEREKFTLTFEADGVFLIHADCNAGKGSYSLIENNLSIGLIALTRAYCGETSLDRQYLQHLDEVNRWDILNDQLMLQMKNSAGFMLFSTE